MNNRNITIGLALIVVAVLGYALGTYQSGNQTSQTNSAMTERKVLYWYDPMSPAHHFDKPGKSPFMDMQLVPRYADEEHGSKIRIDSGVAQNLGMRTAIVEQSPMRASFDASGTMAFNERDVSIVQSLTNGFVRRVFAHAPGDVVQQHEVLAEIVVPEWASAQNEYLALLSSNDKALIDAARSRLALLGMPAEMISNIDASHQVSNTVSIRAPRAGMIAALDIRDGMSVSNGATLATIYGLKTMWLNVAVPESQSSIVALGDLVSAQVVAYPQGKFKGKVAAILPDTNVDTHTLRVRVELDNASGKLRPGMFANVRFEKASPKPALMVPSEAVIRSGTRSVVLRMNDDGSYQPVEVQVGLESDGKTEIISGVSAGERVVASGQFLIDSEANLSGALERMRSTSTGNQQSSASQGSSP